MHVYILYMYVMLLTDVTHFCPLTYKYSKSVHRIDHVIPNCVYLILIVHTVQ